MKERIIVGCLVSLLLMGGLFAAQATDALYVALAVGFFLLCVAYAEGCEKL
jgi:succinate-acetate transporter protein